LQSQKRLGQIRTYEIYRRVNICVGCVQSFVLSALTVPEIQYRLWMMSNQSKTTIPWSLALEKSPLLQSELNFFAHGIRWRPSQPNSVDGKLYRSIIAVKCVVKAGPCAEDRSCAKCAKVQSTFLPFLFHWLHQSYYKYHTRAVARVLVVSDTKPLPRKNHKTESIEILQTHRDPRNIGTGQVSPAYVNYSLSN
jgi:hypothetical protein